MVNFETSDAIRDFNLFIKLQNVISIFWSINKLELIHASGCYELVVVHTNNENLTVFVSGHIEQICIGMYHLIEVGVLIEFILFQEVS